MLPDDPYTAIGLGLGLFVAVIIARGLLDIWQFRRDMRRGGRS